MVNTEELSENWMLWQVFKCPRLSQIVYGVHNDVKLYPISHKLKAILSMSYLQIYKHMHINERRKDVNKKSCAREEPGGAQ